MKEYYDVVISSFSYFETDARTSNLINLLSSRGFKIAWIGLAEKNSEQIEINSNLHLYKVFPGDYPKFFIKRFFWDKKVVSILKNIETKALWAADFYVLPTLNKVKTELKAKIVYDSREIYSALGPIAGKILKQAYITRLEKKLVKNVDLFVVSGELDAEFLKKHFNTDKHFEVIKNLPNFREYKTSNLIKEKYPQLIDKTVIIYQGVVLPGRGLEVIIQAIRDNEEFAFFILGDGFLREELIAKVKELGLSDRIILPGSVNYSQLLEYTASADIGMCYVEPISFSYELALPNKLFEYIMARIPVLCSDLPAMRKIINEYRVGELISPKANSGQIIVSLLKLKENREYYISNCAVASEIFNYEAQSEGIIEFVSDKVLKDD